MSSGGTRRCTRSGINNAKDRKLPVKRLKKKPKCSKTVCDAESNVRAGTDHPILNDAGQSSCKSLPYVMLERLNLDVTAPISVSELSFPVTENVKISKSPQKENKGKNAIPPVVEKLTNTSSKQRSFKNIKLRNSNETHSSCNDGLGDLNAANSLFSDLSEKFGKEYHNQNFFTDVLKMKCITESSMCECENACIPVVLDASLVADAFKFYQWQKASQNLLSSSNSTKDLPVDILSNSNQLNSETDKLFNGEPVLNKFVNIGGNKMSQSESHKKLAFEFDLGFVTECTVANHFECPSVREISDSCAGSDSNPVIKRTVRDRICSQNLQGKVRQKLKASSIDKDSSITVLDNFQNLDAFDRHVQSPDGKEYSKNFASEHTSGVSENVSVVVDDLSPNNAENTVNDGFGSKPVPCTKPDEQNSSSRGFYETDILADELDYEPSEASEIDASETESCNGEVQAKQSHNDSQILSAENRTENSVEAQEIQSDSNGSKIPKDHFTEHHANVALLSRPEETAGKHKEEPDKTGKLCNATESSVDKDSVEYRQKTDMFAYQSPPNNDDGGGPFAGYDQTNFANSFCSEQVDTSQEKSFKTSDAEFDEINNNKILEGNNSNSFQSDEEENSNCYEKLFLKNRAGKSQKRSINSEDDSESDSEHSFKRKSSNDNQGFGFHDEENPVDEFSQSKVDSLLNNLEGVLLSIKKKCKNGKIDDALQIANYYILISDQSTKRDIFAELFFDLMESFRDSNHTVTENVCLDTMKSTMLIFYDLNLWTTELCSDIICKCLNLKLTSSFGKELFAFCQKNDIHINCEAVNAYIDTLKPTDLSLTKMISFLNFISKCKVPPPNFILKQMLHILFKNEEDILVPELTEICKLLCSVDSSRLYKDDIKKFVKLCLEKRYWVQIAHLICNWAQKGPQITWVVEAALSQFENVGFWYDELAKEIYGPGGQVRSDVPLQARFIFGQMGVCLLMEASSKKDYDSAFDVLLVLHRFNINYLDYPAPMCKASWYLKHFPDPTKIFAFPFTVFFTALDICLHLDRPKDAFMIFKSLSLDLPKEFEDALKLEIRSRRFHYLLKIALALEPKDPLGRGIEAFRSLLSTAQNDFTLEQLGKYSKDLQVVYNKFMVCVLNAQKGNLIKEFYQYSHGPMKEFFTLDCQVLRGLIVFFENCNMLDEVNTLFDLGKKNIYEFKKVSEINSINEVKFNICKQCQSGNIPEAISFANRYIAISVKTEQLEIFKELFINVIELIKDSVPPVDDVIISKSLGEVMNIFHHSKLFNADLCSLIINKCFGCEHAIETGKSLFSFIQEIKVPVNRSAISSYLGIIMPSEFHSLELISFMEYVKNVCKLPCSRTLLREALRRFSKQEEDSLALLFPRLCELLCSVSSNEVSLKHLQNFIQFCIKNDHWTQISNFFQAWCNKDDHLISCLAQSFLFRPEDVGLFYEKLAEEIYKQGDASPHLECILRHVGVFLMMELFSKKQYDSAFDVLFTLHKHNINYLELQACLYLAVSYLKSYPHFTDVVVFPFTVAFAALDICLHLERFRDAYHVFKSFSLDLPKEFGDALKLEIRSRRFHYLLKIALALEPKDPLGRGIEAFRSLLSTAQNDFTLEQLSEYSKDLPVVYNKYMVCFLNAQKENLIKEFYPYSHGPMKEFFTLDCQVLRGLIVFFVKYTMLDEANTLFDLGKKNIYEFKKPALLTPPWRMVVNHNWTSEEIKLTFLRFTETLNPVLRLKKRKDDFDRWFSVKILIREVPEVAYEVDCLKNWDLPLERISTALKAVDSQIQWKKLEKNKHVMHLIPESFYTFWFSQCSKCPVSPVPGQVFKVPGNVRVPFGEFTMRFFSAPSSTPPRRSPKSVSTVQSPQRTAWQGPHKIMSPSAQRKSPQTLSSTNNINTSIGTTGLNLPGANLNKSNNLIPATCAETVEPKIVLKSCKKTLSSKTALIKKKHTASCTKFKKVGSNPLKSKSKTLMLPFDLKSIKITLQNDLFQNETIRVVQPTSGARPVIKAPQEDTVDSEEESNFQCNVSSDVFDKIKNFLDSKVMLKCKDLTIQQQQRKALRLARAFIESNVVSTLNKKTMKLLSDFSSECI